MKRKIKKFIGKIIWNLSESLNISLGVFAPKIFEWMIGYKGIKK
jgi:hypothetical protein